MADYKTGDVGQYQMEPTGFYLTAAQKEELKNRIEDLLLSFESDRNLIEPFLQSPFAYVEENHPISFLVGMNSRMPDLAFSFDQAIRRLRLEFFASRGKCLHCILSILAFIYAFLLHFGLSVDLLKSVVAEVVLGLADLFNIKDKLKGALELVAGLSTIIAPVTLAKRFCRMMGLCKKVVATIDLDTIGSALAEKEKSEQARKSTDNLRKGGTFDL